MNRVKGKLSVLLVFLLITVSLTACDESNKAPTNSNSATGQEGWPDMIKIGSSAPGGYWFTVAAAFCEIINDKLPGVTATPTSGGQVANIRNCASGEQLVSLGCNYTEVDAYNGADPFEEKITNIRSIGNLYPSQWHVITLEEANIKTIEDLKGHDFSPGTKGMGGEIMAQRILAEYGMTYDDLGNMNLTGYDDAALLMKDKHIDAMFIQMLAPAAAFVDVGTFTPLRIIGVGEDKMDEVCSKYSLFPGVVPAGAYPGQEQDVIAPCATNEFIVNDSLPEDFVYELTKALWENADKIKSVSNGLEGYVKIEDALTGLGLPLHKGAYKYYVEQGMDVPDNIKPID